MKAIAQLIRLPNVFTAIADIALGALAAGYLVESPGVFAALAAVSACLYCSGMAWNDYFDREADARFRPHRPIPSGRLSPRQAMLIALALMLAGLVLAAAASCWTMQAHRGHAFFLALLLASAILLYDGLLKATPVGPLLMALCRLLNVLLGLSGNLEAVSFAASMQLGGAVSLYILGVTLLARQEESNSAPRQLWAAAVVIGSGLLLGFFMPWHRPPGSVPWYLPFLFVAFALYLGQKLHRAIRQPTAVQVQAAVKECLLGLIVLDALLAAMFVGWPGLLLILLLLPARWLARWLYVT